MSNPCIYCQTPLVRRVDEHSANFKRRRTCDAACKKGAAHNAKVQRAEEKHGPNALADKPCCVCQKPFSPRPNEVASRFVNRDTCGNACGSVVGAMKREGLLPETRKPSSLKKAWATWSDTDRLIQQALMSPNLSINNPGACA